MKTAVVAFCFLLSGGSGLVFETLWTRKLTQVFDSTTLSVSSVLTAFMAGLALGSFVFGRRLADRTRRPIVWYGLLEGAIGLWGLLVPIAIEYVYPHLNRFLWDHFEPGFLSFSLLRFVFVLVLLLPPTTAMGATLPLLSRHFVRSQDEMRRVGKRVGALYSLNTLGAVAGTFAAGYVLMPAIGFAWTNRVAAMTCMCVCGLILAIFGRRGAEPSRSTPDP
ncbi:MAG: fused MFS/spermidine synthase, partial [Myxococcota bacterium]|nr:fused MFS/spermidine synthase [Myxococcota bacterium]